MASNCP